MFLKPMAAAILSGIVALSAVAAENVTKKSGGSIIIDRGHGFMINKESTLTREWITVHDNSLPADILGTTGVVINPESGQRAISDSYQYNSVYTITTQEPLSAIEVRFLTFDIWGDHAKNLSATHIVDMDGGASKELGGTWRVRSQNEASLYYASIAYIAQVRTKNGRVIKANPQIVLEQARMFSKKFSEGDLEPKPENK